MKSSKQKSNRIESPGEKKTPQRMIFANEAGHQIAAIAEQDRLTDFWIQEEQRVDRGASGNIYRGIVVKVIPALNAAFVDIGLDRHGFLSYNELAPKKHQQKKHKSRGGPQKQGIEQRLKAGDTILVQIEKEAIGGKGPSLTGRVSLPGRFLVYMPYTNAIRMSKMLDETEKKHFHDLIKNEIKIEGGVILRTASKGRSKKDIQHDLGFLTRTWKRIESDFETAEGSKLLHREFEVFERALRDNFSPNISEIIVDHPRLKYRIAQFLKVISPRSNPDQLIKFHTDKTKSVWSAYNLVRDFDRFFSNRITLDCGGSIIIEEMETLTAIDVNSGKNVAGKTQEETILETNLEAAQEIPRQLRLRQIGGIIIIDFIDMRLKRNQEKVFKILERELKKDRTPSDIQQFTDLGLIQITRQRVGQSLTKRLTFTCPHCNGSGRRPSIALV